MGSSCPDLASARPHRRLPDSAGPRSSPHVRASSTRAAECLAIVAAMRRGLLKDLANTPTQIACGWRLYGDLPRLRQLSGSVVTVDLLNGTATVENRELSQRLEIAEETSRWLRDRFERDGVPPETVTAARLTLTPRTDKRGMLTIKCATVLETESRTYDSRDSTCWARGD
jgi:hypothetical protein